ncbi:protein FAM237A-like [Petromyzon marinus]|uniref:protein FAM237A-like n=1 Tax=Petromyzon marinus TaxID=7757 RepID=UPI003F6F035D
MPRYQEKTPRWGKPFLWLLVVLGLVVPCLPRGDIDVLSLNEVNPQCWEWSTIAVIKMQKPRMTHTVGEFWNFMLGLKNSDNPHHAKNFWDLAQLFWDKYVQCVISISHGLGRRETATAVHSAVHSPRRAPDFASVPHRQAGLLMKMSFPTYLERIIKKFQQF